MTHRDLTLVASTSALSPLERAEIEWVKDVVDVRDVPGVRYNDHRSNHLLNFTAFPDPFRPVFKQFLKFKLAGSWSYAQAQISLVHTRLFLTWFYARHPEVQMMQHLTVEDIDEYLRYLKGGTNHYGKERSARNIWDAINQPKAFLRYLQRIKSPLAPIEPIDNIIWPEHGGKKPQHNLNAIKYIPESVLLLLDKHIQDLPEAYRPVVILLRASGWRISDVLNLRLDTCLGRTFDKATQKWKWDLVGDIQKTRVLGHKIPIDEGVAILIEAQQALVKQRFSEAQNPKHYLFPALTRRREGRPLGADAIYDALNRLAATHEIRGEDGQIFRFGLHAFRHSKAVELINKGMPLVYVQQWMAHLSPEMTTVYARIQADTMRKEWEKTTAKGIVRFNDGQPEYLDGKKALAVVNDTSFDPLRVRENRANVKMPLGTCTKTDKIVCRFFELPCFHCIAYVLTPDDLPALEAYEQEVVARIELAEANGQAPWAEFNRQNLETRIHPALAMLREGQTYAKGNKYDREYTPEEWEQRQARRQQEGQA